MSEALLCMDFGRNRSDGIGSYIRLIGIWERAQNACRSSVVDQRSPSSQGRCFEFLNLRPTRGLEFSITSMSHEPIP